MSDEAVGGWRCWNRADARSARRYLVACVLWAGSYGLTIQALKRGWLEPPAALWLALVPLLFGLYLVSAFIRFLRGLDELQRRIQVDALALAFGVGFLFSTSYRLFERLGAPQLDVDDALLPMVLTWMIGTWWGTKRYA